MKVFREMKVFVAFISLIETIAVSIIPFFLYGFWRGILIGSALTSLLHIVFILKKLEEKK